MRIAVIFQVTSAIPSTQIIMSGGSDSGIEASGCKDISNSIVWGSSEMGVLMRSHDWSQTPLGPPAHWPQSLQTAISILLGFPGPMFIWWGEHLISFYNDACHPLLRQLHPQGLGRSAREIWAKSWPWLEPHLESCVNAVMQQGRASSSAPFLAIMERNGRSEAAYFTTSYSPIGDGQGCVGGILGVCTDVTWHVLNEHRLGPWPDWQRSVKMLSSAPDIAEQKRTEAALRESEHRYRMLFESIDQGFCICEMLFDASNMPIDYRFLNVNPAFERLTGLQQVIGKTVLELVPDLEPFWFEVYGRVVLMRESHRFEHQSSAMNRWFDVNAFPIGEPDSHRFAILFTNVTSRKTIEQERERFLSVGSDLQVITGRNGYFLWVSPTFERILGWNSMDMMSQPWTAFIHPDDLDPSLLEADRLFSGHKTFAFENRYRHKDGSYRWFLWNARAYPEDQVLYGAAIDITNLKQVEETLRQREAELRLVTNAVPALISFVDSNQRYRFSNQEYEEWFGTEAGIYGKHLREVLGEKAYQEILPFVEQVLAGQQVTYERQLSYRNGGTRYVRATYVPRFNQQGDVEGFVALVSDISDRKQAEQERERLLARERAARAEAERANRIKDEFLAIVSHELRSPLNPILGWSSLLQTRRLDAAKTQQALSTIARNAKLQAELIEDLLDISRILRGKLSLNVAPTDLVFTIQAALETVRLAAEAKFIQLQTHLDAEIGPVAGDASRLQQVVWNLLSNAIKFTPQGGRVDIALERVGTQAQIRVRDTGIGIHPDFLPYVFDYFRQEDGATTRKFGGLGLGLAIVHHLVELHGGTAEAHSPGEGQGATFIVRLPLLPASPSHTSNSRVSDSNLDLTGLQILIVDDDEDTREFVAFLIAQYGAAVIIAASARDAIASLTHSKVDVLLSDIGMPEMDGYSLMQRVRRLPPEQGGQIPAIALTAYAGEIDYQQAMAAGFQRHVPKPVDPIRLVEAIVSLARPVAG